MTTSYAITLLNLYHLQNTWASHYNRISNGTNTLTILHQMGKNHWALLKRNFKVANTDIKSRAYQSLVSPKLEDSCSAWDPHAKDQQLKLEKSKT